MLSKSELKKKYIVEQAKRLFIELGFQAVTMTDVVEACNISRGGLYRYYKNTRDIFIDVLDIVHETEDFNLYKAMENEQSASHILETFFIAQKKELCEETTSLTQAMYEFFFMYKNKMEKNVMQERFNEAEHIFTELIQYGMDKGEFKQVTPRIVARHIILLLEGLRVSSQVMSVDEALLNEQFQLIQTYLLKES